MNTYPPPGRLKRKWRKFRYDPVRFFADAKNPLVRKAGLWTLAGRYLVSDGAQLLRLTRGEGVDLLEALARLHAPKMRRAVATGISRHDYARWIARNDTLSQADRAAIRTRIAAMETCPAFSILMPVHDPNPAWLAEAIASVTAQLYPGWELCIVDDASTDPAVDALLRRQASEDSRIKVATRAVNGGIAAACNDALAMASGEWVATLDHDDRLAEHALYHVAEATLAHSDAAIIYSDEDHLTPEGEREAPCFKPDWNYELALGQNLANHLTACRRADMLAAGGYREGFDGAQDWDLLLRLVEGLAPDRIVHIPHVLYHWRVSESSFSQARAEVASEAGRRAVAGHLARTGQNADVAPNGACVGHMAVRWRLPADPPLVSIIIPTRDRVDLLRQCIDGLTRRTEYPKMEILIIDNGSVLPATRAFYAELGADPRIRILEEPGEFNFSRLCNRGVAAARGTLYVLLNNDVDPINPDWLSEMAAHALRPGVGAVGAKLYYPDGTIQHGGVILGLGGVAGHAHKHLPRDSSGYQGRARLAQRMTAVTGACLAGRKAIYEEVGGLDEENLKVAFNDVDFCLRLGEAGYAVIWTPFAELHHHESASRGVEIGSEKRARSGEEGDWMRDNWERKLLIDCQNAQIPPPRLGRLR